MERQFSILILSILMSGLALAEHDYDPCQVLRNAIDFSALGTTADAVEFRKGEQAHPLCRAFWPNPDYDISDYQAQINAHSQRRVQAMTRGEKFNEPMPKPGRTDSEVNLTITNNEYESAAAAVQSLEELVARMKKGITTTVGGKEYTTRIEYQDWPDGVGDKAAWSVKPPQLSVAASGILFHLGVNVDDDISNNRKQAIEIAGSVVDQL